jgi:hypothetical protein
MFRRIAGAALATLGVVLGLAYVVLSMFIDLDPNSYSRLTVRHSDAGTFPSGLHGWRLAAAVLGHALPGLLVATMSALAYVLAVRKRRDTS